MRVDARLTGVPMLSFAESVQGRVKAPGLLAVWWLCDSRVFCYYWLYGLYWVFFLGGGALVKDQTYRSFFARPAHVLDLNGELLDDAPVLASLASEV